MNFFHKLICYKCSFFFTINDLMFKLKSELSFSELNKNFIYPLKFYFIVVRVFKTILCKNIYNYYMSHVFSINSKI